LSGTTAGIPIKTFVINGQEVRVSVGGNPAFYGRYSGDKNGFLQLNSDGTGEYRYDYMLQSAPDCSRGVISMEWGFLVDDSGEMVRFSREYGYSYPIIYLCPEGPCFQGCRKTFMVDYILEKSDGSLSVSSSDNWSKK
jgi:hypothetical protein